MEHFNTMAEQKKSRKEESEVKRFQINFTPERLVELEELMVVVGAPTKKDLINNALSLLNWMVKEVKDGRIIASLDEVEMKYKELVMPLLDEIKARCANAEKLRNVN